MARDDGDGDIYDAGVGGGVGGGCGGGGDDNGVVEARDEKV